MLHGTVASSLEFDWIGVWVGGCRHVGVPSTCPFSIMFTKHNKHVAVYAELNCSIVDCLCVVAVAGEDDARVQRSRVSLQRVPTKPEALRHRQGGRVRPDLWLRHPGADCCLYVLCFLSFGGSPWYDCNGWLGVKHEVTYLLTFSLGGDWSPLLLKLSVLLWL